MPSDVRTLSLDTPRLTRFLADSVGGMVDVWKAHGDIATFDNAGRLTVFVSGASHNRVLFSRTDALHVSTGLPGPRNSAQRAFGRGIFGLNGEEHHAARRLLLPQFRKPTIESYHNRLVQYVREVTDTWRDGQTRDLYREMKAISLAMTDRLLFGLDDIELAQRVDRAFEDWLDWNHRAGFGSSLPVATDETYYPQLLESAENLGELLRSVIAARRKRPLTGDDLLAPLLSAQAAGELTETDVLGLVHSLFNAAHHTTSESLTWALFLIAQHPEINAGLVAELEAARPKLAPDHFDHLDLLDRTIKESMRLLPPVVYVSRVSVLPVQFGNVVIPPRAVVIGGLYVTMHNPALFARPERFEPARWIHHGACPHSNVPFGAGARMCLGAPLATHLMQVVLGLILPRFRLTVVPGTQIDRRATLTLRPAQGIAVLIRDQDSRFSASPVAGNIHDMVELPSLTSGAVAA